MHVIPVIDILNGHVVRGIAGKRSEYQPIQSRFTRATGPLAVALAIRQTFGLNRLYVADLDAIIHDRVSLSLYAELAKAGFETWIDAGLRDQPGAAAVLAAGASSLIAGLETIPGPGFLHELCHTHGPERVVFSLDLQAGRPLGDTAAWQSLDPLRIALQAIAAGVRRIIVLDLAQVGVGAGVSTLELCRTLKDQDAEVEVITGGGVRHLADLVELKTQGIDGVLVASALHEGRIGVHDIRALDGTGRD